VFLEKCAFVRGARPNMASASPISMTSPLFSTKELPHASVTFVTRAIFHSANCKHTAAASQDYGSGLEFESLAARFCEGAAADRHASKTLMNTCAPEITTCITRDVTAQMLQKLPTPLR
jgi:hypothetical protein